MTRDGYVNRLYACEWHARLWAQNGVPFEHCERLVHHLQEVLDADWFGLERPETDDPHITKMTAYLDGLFASDGNAVSFD